MEENLKPIKVVIGLGSNYGNRYKSVADAIAWLQHRLSEVNTSDIYETPAYGKDGDPYMNAVLIGICLSGDSLENFEKKCKEYELCCGRDEEARRQNHVPIDIDIVMAGQKILRPNDFSRQFFQIGYTRIAGR